MHTAHNHNIDCMSELIQAKADLNLQNKVRRSGDVVWVPRYIITKLTHKRTVISNISVYKDAGRGGPCGVMCGVMCGVR